MVFGYNKFCDDCFLDSKNKLLSLPLVTSKELCPSTVSGRINNVDYFSFQLSEEQLYKCWRFVHDNRFIKMYEMLNISNLKDQNAFSLNQVEDLMMLIPSTSSVRLENAAWRHWAKRRNQLKEVNPEKLNWNKENDITWLYGPLVTDAASDLENVGMSRCSSLETLNSLATVDTEATTYELTPKSILKSSQDALCFYNEDEFQIQGAGSLHTRKRVSFSEVVGKREIVGNCVFDSDYHLDA